MRWLRFGHAMAWRGQRIEWEEGISDSKHLS